MKITHIVFALLSACILAASNASAETKHSYSEENKNYYESLGNKVNALYQELELTLEQQEKLKENKENYLQKKSDIYQKIQQARAELNTELQKPVLDMDKMQRIHAWIKKLKSAKENLRFESIMEVREILNAQQFTKFMEIKEKHRANWKKNNHK